ncbi:unnamed protein product [Danaus chrysippus]|uniref:(African queen) hypothetical protein n=1 Tax=Danaus chrysippus TaxID=151541 RepID=A0A8J2W0X8_9NEOP|nr:unnamed protein product [Danaus chrysippus]
MRFRAAAAAAPLPARFEAEASDTTPSSSDTEEDNDGFKPVLTKSGKRKAAKSLKAPPPNKKPSTPAAAGAAAHVPAGTPVSAPVSAPAETAPEENLDRLIKKHFAIESFGVQPRRPTTDAEGKARQILESTTKQLRDGRFETGLLWRNEDEPTPDNLRSTENRLRHIERKLDRDPKLKAEYGRQVQHLLDSGYADEVPEDGGSARRWYLPHFAVTHPTKRRLDRKFKTSITGEEKEAKHLVAVVSPSSLPTPDPVRFSRERTLSTRSSDPVWTKKHNKKKTKAQHSAPLAIKERYQERKAVESQQPLDRKSKLKRLDIAVNDGLIRIRGRIDAAEELDRDLRQPVVLDAKDDITKLILTHYHDKFNHGNHATVMNEVRRRFWVLDLRSAVRAIAHRCQWCLVRPDGRTRVVDVRTSTGLIKRPSSKIVRLVSQPTVEDKIAEQQRGGPEQLRVAGQEDGAKHEGEDVGDAANT